VSRGVTDPGGRLITISVQVKEGRTAARVLLAQHRSPNVYPARIVWIIIKSGKERKLQFARALFPGLSPKRAILGGEIPPFVVRRIPPSHGQVLAPTALGGLTEVTMR
jgi:hypothetical protein